MNKQDVKNLIIESFTEASYPGDDNLADGTLDEPLEVAEAFRGKKDWRTLEVAFIDQAPGGLGSSLSFFSIEAFRFYLPAYLLADLDDALEQQDPVFKLCDPFQDICRTAKHKYQGAPDKTWFELASERYQIFTPKEISAIVSYLKFTLEQVLSSEYPSESEFDMISEALNNYWLLRVA